MAEQLWFAVLFTAGMAGFWWLVRRGEAPPTVGAEGVAFRYPVGVAYVGWAFLALATVFIGWMATAFGVESEGDRWALAAVAALCALPGLAFVAAHRREWARLTETGIEVRGLFASEAERLRWADVERVSFGRGWGALAFRAIDGRTVRVSGFFQGADYLAEAIGRRLPDRGGPEAARELLDFRRQFGG